VKSDCQHSFGSSAQNRRYDDLGRFPAIGYDGAGTGQDPVDRRPRQPDLMVMQ
jgi:hypothetical protein